MCEGLLQSHAGDSGNGTHWGPCLGQEPGQFVRRERGKADVWANTGRWVDMRVGARRDFLLWLLFSQCCRKQPDKGWGRRYWEFKEKKGYESAFLEIRTMRRPRQQNLIAGPFAGCGGPDPEPAGLMGEARVQGSPAQGSVCFGKQCCPPGLHPPLWAGGEQCRAAHSPPPAVGASKQL